MDNYNTYIDLMGKACVMMRDGKRENKELKDLKELQNLLAQIEALWDKLTDEEQTWADEQTLRTRLYLGV